MRKIKLLLFTLFICLISISGVRAVEKLTCKYTFAPSSNCRTYITLSFKLYEESYEWIQSETISGITDTCPETPSFFNNPIQDVAAPLGFKEGSSCPENMFLFPDKNIISYSNYIFGADKPEIFTLDEFKREDLYSSSCINYSKKEDCTTSFNHGKVSCVWVENEDAPGGGFCNVDNLLYVGCGDASDIPLKVPELISFAVNLLKIATPIILIFISIISLLKALASQKDDEIKKATSSLVKKIIAAVLVFFVIGIVQFVISKVASDKEYTGITNCFNCFLNNNCETSTYYKTVVAGEDLCTFLTDGNPKSCDELFGKKTSETSNKDKDTNNDKKNTNKDTEKDKGNKETTNDSNRGGASGSFGTENKDTTKDSNRGGASGNF